MQENPISTPKIEQYGSVLFIVARTAQIVRGRVAFGETHLFVGQGYVVSVRHGASESYANVRERCESSPVLLSQGEDHIALCDPRLYRRQLRASLERNQQRGGGSGSRDFQEDAQTVINRSLVHAAPRAPAAA